MAIRAIAVIVILLLVLIVISLALVLGIALGIGWILTLFLPFTLFEGTILGMITVIVVGAIWYELLRYIPDFASEPYAYDEDEDEDEEDVFELNEIPASRFYKTDADKTWEAWLRYAIANDIYAAFQVAPRQVAPLGDKQVQELAIRLADIAIAILKTKTARVKRLKVTQAALKRQMNKMGQRPYDDDILGLAVPAINVALDYYYEDIIAVIRDKSWDKLAD